MSRKREYIIRELNSVIDNIKRDVDWEYVLDELSNIVVEIDNMEEDD